MPSVTAKSQKVSERVVVLLKPREKQRLERLARAQHVSSAEIMRRSLQAYEERDESVEKAAIAEMNTLLDGMLATLRNTREHVQRTLTSIEHQKRVSL